MISIKKFIDSNYASSAPSEAPRREPDAGNLLSAYQVAYQTVLAAMGAQGQRAVPALGAMIFPALMRISDGLNQSVTPESIRDSRRAAEEQLSLWADQAQQNQKDNEKTIKNLLHLIFEATESTGTRDEKFSQEIVGLAEKLRTVAGLESLPVIRRTITENTAALTSCVARMADEGRESVRQLTSEIAEYQTRLLASERRALVDPLTGLCNRRAFEQQLEFRVQSRQPFSLLVADLNGFKAINDRYGHLVGDELLRQFAGELKAQFFSEDTVARWGGDEFVAIVVGQAKEGVARVERVRHWALGEYKITIDNLTTAVTADAALGIVIWNGAESGLELFSRADKEMYRAKEQSRVPA